MEEKVVENRGKRESSYESWLSWMIIEIIGRFYDMDYMCISFGGRFSGTKNDNACKKVHSIFFLYPITNIFYKC